MTKDPSSHWYRPDVVVIKCDGARDVGGRCLRSRRPEAVPLRSAGKPPHLGLPGRAYEGPLRPMRPDACQIC